MVKDQAVAALINKKDRPAFVRLAAKVRKEVNFAIKRSLPYEGKTITEFWNQCFRKHNDHDGIFEIGNRKVGLEAVSIADDLAVNAGLDQCIRLIMATSTALWRYMEIGGSNNSATLGDTALFSPYTITRCDMSLLGSREPVGMTIRFLAIFYEGFPTTTIKECGIFSQVTGGILLNHNTFKENPLNKIVNQQAAIISSVIEFCPRA